MAMIADALIGELVGQLLGAVIEMQDKARHFRPTLEKLQDTLESLEPDVDRIVQLSRKQDRPWEPKKLIGLMTRGRELVLECSTTFPIWNRVQKKAYYKKILDELDASILRYFQLELQSQVLIVGLETRSVITESRCEQIGSAAVLPGNQRVESSPWKKTSPEKVDVKPIAKTWEIEEKIKLHEEVKSVVVVTMNNERVGSKVCAAPAPPEFTVGLDVLLNKLKLRLLQKETAVSVITVTGPGGSGKTTLAKMLCWDDQVKGKFKENVFFVTFAKNPKLNTIVQDLFQRNGHQVPKFQSEKDAIDQLENLMKQIGNKGPILLVLDDVQLGSESIVDKFVFPIPNYKILVTSRYAIARYGSRYILEPLSREDATSLLLYSASLNESSSNIPDSIVKEIVKACKGSPLALEVTRTSLKNKNLAVWRSRAKALSKRQSTLESDQDVLTCLHKSLDVLNSKAVDCFKDLGLFPQGQRIPVAALVDMWAELHSVNDETAMDILNELVNLNLADIIVTRKVASDIVDYNYHYVVLHDLLRDLAIHRTSQEPEDKRNKLIIEINGNNLPKWWSVQKEYPTPARILSISTDEAFSSEWCNLQPNEVEALVLNLQGKKYKLPMFMKKMNKLKVLTITNYVFYPAELENFELLDHLPNLKRLRLENFSIHFLSKIGVHLKSLLKCSFSKCNVNEAYENCTTQVSDMLPNLLEMSFDYCIMVKVPIVPFNCLLLKNLRITNCYELFALPEEIGKLVNLETLWLNSCIGLLELPHSITSLENLQFLDISYCISLSKLPEDMGKLRNLDKLNLIGCSRLTKLPTSIIDLGNLKYVVCDEEMAGLWEPFKQNLSDLELHVIQADFNLDLH